ncbi:calcium-binding protein [Salipiger marinus]|uniref:Hemolysin-type calcium-binding repeat-containing protein n=1 Tax=Salipiger marinus TaxID=555512 RepID=A0A1G8KYB1_9RHOB|nr:calcium-binding protein [Salipiger marinus]SDI47870.1 Hemolysin-type calcium-binding repeat-containing protein [Salipiger marinus]
MVRAGFGNDMVSIAGGEVYIDGGAGQDVLSANGVEVGIAVSLHTGAEPGSETNFVSGGATPVTSYARLAVAQDADRVGSSGIGRSLGVTPIAVSGPSDGATQQGTGFVNFEDVIGGNGDDTITGNEVDNALLGDAGNDSIDGGAGNDVVNGGTGDDTLKGGAGRDILLGGSGNDVLVGLDPEDEIDGGAGVDTLDLSGEVSDRTIDMTLGGSAHGVIANVEGLLTGDGAEGNDTLDGLQGDDLLYGGAGSDSLRGEAGNDVLSTAVTTGPARPGHDVLDGGGHDAGTAGDVVSFNAQPADFGVQADLATGAADASLSGTEGLVGTDLDDRLFGDGADNLLDGEAGDDLILGRDGNDALLGDAGGDTLMGGGGDDYLAGGDGRNVLSGGAGDDTFLLDGGQNRIFGCAGQDVVEVQKVIVQETDAKGRVIREVTSDFDIIEENGTLTVLHYAERGGVLTELGRAEFGADVETICIFDPIPSDQAATQGFDSRDRRVAQDIDVATLPNELKPRGRM